MSEVAVKAMPRRGRLWVILVLALGLAALGYAIVGIATKKAGHGVVHIAGITEAQEIFGGVPQEGDRLGSSDAPVTIQIFNDLQCSSCREDFLSTIPGLTKSTRAEDKAKLLYRHYSVSESPVEEGFYGAEAAAAQGYGWQYTYLFFRNQKEAERFGLDEESAPSASTGLPRIVAGGIEELNFPEWKEDLEENGGKDGVDHQAARRLRRTRHQPRHPHPPGRDRHRPQRHQDAPGRPVAGSDRTGDRRSAVVGLSDRPFVPGKEGSVLRESRHDRQRAELDGSASERSAVDPDRDLGCLRVVRGEDRPRRSVTGALPIGVGASLRATPPLPLRDRADQGRPALDQLA